MPRTLTSLVLHTTVLVSAMTFATTSVADEKTTAGKTIVKVGDVDQLVDTIKSLGALEGRSNAAISTLIRFLFDDSAEVRLEAIKALRKSGDLALGAAAPILSRMSQIDSDASVKREATETLRLLGREAHFVNGLNPVGYVSVFGLFVQSDFRLLIDRPDDEQARRRKILKRVLLWPLSELGHLDEVRSTTTLRLASPVWPPAPSMPYPLDPLPLGRPLSQQDVSHLMAMVNGDVSRLR